MGGQDTAGAGGGTRSRKQSIVSAESIPGDSLTEIFFFLPARDLLVTRVVCSFWKSMASGSLLWQRLCWLKLGPARPSTPSELFLHPILSGDGGFMSLHAHIRKLPSQVQPHFFDTLKIAQVVPEDSAPDPKILRFRMFGTLGSNQACAADRSLPDSMPLEGSWKTRSKTLPYVSILTASSPTIAVSPHDVGRDALVVDPVAEAASGAGAGVGVGAGAAAIEEPLTNRARLDSSWSYVSESGQPASRCFLTAHLVSYFELKVDPPDADPITGRYNSGERLPRRWRQDCAAIGLATKHFPLSGKFPGWDSHSYGWHSDDGKVFHDSGAGRTFGSKWGEGDTVGCGIIYSLSAPGTGSVFFTRNGEFVGVAFPFISTATRWYPVIGIDTSSTVTVNFGAKPFKFDLERFELRMWQTTLHSPIMKSLLAGVKDEASWPMLRGMTEAMRLAYQRMPELPSMPRMPSLPTMPAMPSMPSFPHMPSLDSLLSRRPRSNSLIELRPLPRPRQPSEESPLGDDRPLVLPHGNLRSRSMSEDLHRSRDVVRRHRSGTGHSGIGREVGDATATASPVIPPALPTLPTTPAGGGRAVASTGGAEAQPGTGVVAPPVVAGATLAAALRHESPALTRPPSAILPAPLSSLLRQVSDACGRRPVRRAAPVPVGQEEEPMTVQSCIRVALQCAVKKRHKLEKERTMSMFASLRSAAASMVAAVTDEKKESASLPQPSPLIADESSDDEAWTLQPPRSPASLALLTMIRDQLAARANRVHNPPTEEDNVMLDELAERLLDDTASLMQLRMGAVDVASDDEDDNEQDATRRNSV